MLRDLRYDDGVKHLASLGCALALVALAPESDVRACSCVGPQVSLLSPAAGSAPATTTHVRILAPSRSGGAFVLREPGGGPIAARITRSGMGSVDLVELAPEAALAPGTRYEIAHVVPERYPSTYVFGTFRTGAAADAQAPRIDALGAVTAQQNTNAMSSACQSGAPRVLVEGLRVSDPGGDPSRLLLAAWLEDASGKVDVKRSPAFVTGIGDGGRAVLGNVSICDPRSLALPKAPSVKVALAVVDESGNTSAPRVVQVSLAGISP